MSLIASRIDETPYGGGSGEKVDGVRGNITMNFLKSASREGAEEKTIRRAATFIICLSTIALAGLSIVRWSQMPTLPEPTFIENVAAFAGLLSQILVPGGWEYILLLSIALVLRRSKSRVAAGALVFLSAGNVVLFFYWSRAGRSLGDYDISRMAGISFALIIWTFSLLITVRALQATMTLKKALPPPLPVIPNPRVMEPHATKTCSMALGGTAFEASDHFPHNKELGEGDDADVPDVPGETMKPLRYFLIISSAIWFAFLSYTMGKEYTKTVDDLHPFPPNVPWFVWLFWISLALNFFYLVFSNSSKPSSGRIS